MDMEVIMSLVTIIVTIILSIIAKKVSWITNHIIPLQNLIIGIVISVIYYIMTKNISIAVASAGLLVGGTYDLVKNLNKLINKKQSEEVIKE